VRVVQTHATVLVSLTTIPSRVGRVGDVIRALLDQSFAELEVRLYVPRVCRRLEARYEIPTSLPALAAEDSRFSILRTETDYGPATKLLAPYGDILAGEGAARRFLMTVDDDVLLEVHAVEELVAASARHPGEALGFMGATGDTFTHAEGLSAAGLSNAEQSVLGGYRGILYPVEVLNESLFRDYEAVSDRCGPFLDDDHLFAWNLARRGIRRRVIATRHPGPSASLNTRLLELPDSVTHGDGGRTMASSHRCLVEYYEENGWSYPL
jgi:hypothetical protein